MSKAEQFEALALLCEQVTGADRRLDVDIAIATRIICGMDPSSVTEAYADETNIGWVDYWYEGLPCTDSVASFTASLDEAMTLVPEGYVVNLGNDEPILAQVWIDNDPASRGDGATMPLALCAAALRARAQMERGK